MLPCYDSFLAEKRYLIGALLKETKILECKKDIVNKEKFQKDGKVETQALHQEQDQLIKRTMAFLRTCLYLKFIPSGTPSCSRMAN